VTFAVQTGQDRYKWVALANTTFGVVMATIDSSIMLIALPDIFQGIHLSPLQPGNSFYLLWMILSFLVVSSVLVVSLGRLGDMFGRVRMYNLGFAVYTLSSLVLTVDWLQGQGGALYLVVGRIFQGVGAAFLVANSSAILTDAFPEGQRGLALGVNNVAGISGSFIGLVLGGVLGPVDWRLVFLVSVPFGLAGTLWAHYKLHELSARRPAKVDWPGNVTFACGLVAVMVGITYGIQPYGGHDMGWSNPAVIAELAAGAALLVAFCAIERRSAEPMFRLQLFRIRAFTAGVLSSFLAALARGGLMFMMIIWLQGIWLPEHGYSFGSTPLWAGIYMLPLTAGFLVAGPVSGLLSDRFGARPFACRHGKLCAAPAPARRLLLLAVRRLVVPQRARDGRVREPQPGGRDEQPARPAPGRGIGHERDLPKLGSGAVDRHLLHARHRGVVVIAALQPVARAGEPRGAPVPGCTGGEAAARVDLVRRVPRLRPDGAPPAPSRPPRPHPGPVVDIARPLVFPAPDRGAFRVGPAHCFGLCSSRLRRGGRRVLGERQALCVPARGRRRHDRGGRPRPGRRTRAGAR
jgi:MFS family permease